MSISRALLPSLLACALPLVSMTWAPAAIGQTDGAAPVVSGLLEQCLSTGVQAERAATFSGEMTAIAGTARMTMRIEVQERMPGEELFHTVSAPGLGGWRGSNPGVKIYKYVKQITNLSSPADYRALVRFRWLDDKNHVIRRAERLTLKCAQPASPPPSPSTPLE